jgi:hypothetical protein
MPTSWQDAIARWSDYRIFPSGLLNSAGPTDLTVFLYRQTNTVSAAIAPGAYYTAFLSDGSNFISGEENNISMWSPGWLPGPVGPVHFRIFPHRSKELTIHFFYHNPAGKVSECGSLSFANPKFQNFPVWTPEKLPATKQAGDLGVTLLSVSTGLNNNTSARALAGGGMVTTRGTNRLDGRNETAVELKFQPARTNEVWQVTSVKVSDATSNDVVSMSMNWSGNGDEFAFEPGLWPDEAAWKLKLFLKRTEGFTPEELIVFKGVPLGEIGKTNFLSNVTNIGGVAMGLHWFARKAPSTTSSWSSSQVSELMVTNSVLSNDVYLDLVGAVFETGKTNHSESWSTSDLEHRYSFLKIPERAEKADFIFALQKGRTVEFTVKPELPKPEQVTK